jgi:hypothetical protein
MYKSQHIMSTSQMGIAREDRTRRKFTTTFYDVLNSGKLD